MRQVLQQERDLLAQILAMHDHIEQTMFQEEFRTLEARRQILLSGLLYHAWTGEAYQCPGFRHNHIAERRIACHHACGGLGR